jgi:hypothetical protein
LGPDLIDIDVVLHVGALALVFLGCLVAGGCDRIPECHIACGWGEVLEHHIARGWDGILFDIPQSLFLQMN